MPSTDNKMYLSFDDGPHPEITSWVLDTLKEFGAKATFFCVGENVVKYPEIYRRIIMEGHAVGNHTYNHLNGWKTNDDIYLNNISEAKKHIDSNLFRPPYGKITSFQAKQLKEIKYNLKIVMWSILSGDFDKNVEPEKCAENVLLNAKTGSIVVFHDSEKAVRNLKYALPKVLGYFKERGIDFEKITM